MPTIKDLADEYGTDVDALRRVSNVGDQVLDDQTLTPLQEQNVRGTWQTSLASGTTGGYHTTS